MGRDKWWHPTASGIIGGVCCVYAGQPFDTIKVRLQTQHSNLPKAFKGPIDCLIKTVRSEGPTALYRGASPALASVVTENAVLFTANNLVKKVFIAFNRDGADLTLGQHALAGGLSGVFSSTAICPAEVIKCTLQTQMSNQQTAIAIAPGSSNLLPSASVSGGALVATTQINKPSPLAVIRNIARTEGLTGFFKGLPSLWARDIPFNFAFLGSYEAFLAVFAWQTQTSRDDLSAEKLFTAGGLAGMVGWSVVFPFDSIKSRIQSSVKGLSASQVALKMLREEGIRGFYNGWSAAVMRAFPANAALLLGFELSHRLFNMDDSD